MKNRLAFHGRAGEFFGIWIVNMVLSSITLGIYSAWAKVRTKKYFYGNTELAGDRFDYHATPIQILIGRVIAVVLLAVWLVAESISPILTMVGLIAFILVLPILVRNNARFDARMTSYRNVRFNFTGSLSGVYVAILLKPFVAMIGAGVGVALLTSLTVGGAGMLLAGIGTSVVLILCYAWVMKEITAYFANGYRYGERQLNATLKTSFFVKTYALASLLAVGLLLAVGVAFFLLSSGTLLSLFAIFASGDVEGVGVERGLTVGFIAIYGVFFLWGLIVSSFIAVRTRNYVFGQMATEADQSYQLGSEMATGQYVWLVVSNFFAQLFTLGFSRPWALIRMSRYLVSVTSVTGDMAALSVKDTSDTADSSIGDEVAQVFDVDIGLN